MHSPTESRVGEELSACISMACLLLSQRRKSHGCGAQKLDAPEPGTGKSMTAESLVGMLEEMMDLKIQQYAETQLKVTPELARILQGKRDTDRRRLEQIRNELVRFLKA